MTAFAPLRFQSSLNSNSINEVNEAFQYAKQEGNEAFCICDDGTLHHLFVVSEMIKETGIEKVAFGCSFPFRVASHQVNLALYPKNEKGKKNLIQLSSAFQKGEKKPLRLEGMKQSFSEMNVVVDSEPFDGRAVLEIIRTLSTFCEKEKMFIGLVEDFRQSNKSKNLKIKEVLLKEKVGFVYFNRVLFMDEADFDSYNELMEMKGFKTAQDLSNAYLTKETYEEIFDYMSDMQEQTERIIAATKVDYRIGDNQIKVPSFNIEEEVERVPLFESRFSHIFNGQDEESAYRSARYLFQLVFTGLINRYGKDKLAAERALVELELIFSKKLADYFLVVWDFMKYAKDNGIPVGPGRGSVVASVVAYCLRITEVDPLKYNLQFERFLNVYRKDLPDIDIDVSKKYRDKMISYIRNKYGEDKVAYIVTRSNYGFKNIVTNLLKQARIPSEVVEKMYAYKPDTYSSYEQFLGAASDDCLEFISKHKDVDYLLQHAFKLMGIPQGTSRHAAGLLISSNPLEEDMPVFYDKGRLITQIPNEDNSLEAWGYPKWDLLGLRNLDVISETKKLVELKEGCEYPEINLEDEMTFQMFREGNLKGVFQMESKGMSNTAREMGVSSFKEIPLILALYRPGPMEMIPQFIARKNKPIELVDSKGNVLDGVEELYQVLEETNGFIVYQEQLNQIVAIWAGYPMDRAELFRRAISKKEYEVLVGEKETFLQKSLELGRDPKVSEELFKLILKFADFGFNKAHAVAYGTLCYETAYLKAHHPQEYMISLLNSLLDERKKISMYIEEARRMELNILRPDINASTDVFSDEDGCIRSSLALIRGVGVKNAQHIVSVKGDTPFTSFEDARSRIKEDKLLEKLVRAGALDSLGDRAEMMKELACASKLPYTTGQKIVEEINLTDTFFSMDSKLRKKLETDAKGKEGCVVGVVSSISTMTDKYDKLMARIQVIDFTGATHHLVVFSSVWKKIKIEEGTIILGQLENRALMQVLTINV